MQSFSRDGQDEWVLRMLNGQAKGYFVDIGAYDGVTASNTYLLERGYQWSGICVEPHPRSFNKLKTSRSCFCDNRCIYGSSGSVPFVARGRRQLSGIYDDTCSHSIRRCVEIQGHALTAVACITLAELLQGYNAPCVIDYLSLDTEGSEYAILGSNDFDKYLFKTITVEHNYFSGTSFDRECGKQRDLIFSMLSSHGYQRHCTIGSDDWYIHATIKCD